MNKQTKSEIINTKISTNNANSINYTTTDTTDTLQQKCNYNTVSNAAHEAAKACAIAAEDLLQQEKTWQGLALISAAPTLTACAALFEALFEAL